jgi:putative protease
MADKTTVDTILSRRRAELLSPAGDMERLIMAVTYGADAVYLAGKRFGMRAGAGNFTDEALTEAVRFCHSRRVAVYVTCNTIMREDELRALPPYLEFLQSAGVDALILADLGAFMLAGRVAPGLKRHISTQAGVTNAASANAFYDLGASRIVLARELTLGEIAEIRSNTPASLELEAFVHGSMCMAFSGRCLLSNYLTGRDANGGDCAQPCRWKYHLTEEKRPGQYFEVIEDGGTHLFNSRDLCMIGHLPELLDTGIVSLKIEGRAKSAYYAAVVTNAYRHALDAALQGTPVPAVWLEEVNKVSHRQYATGFYFDRGGPGQYCGDSMYISDCDVVAVVEDCDVTGNAVLTMRNRITAGDRLELLTPDSAPVSFIAACMRDAEGNGIDAAIHPMMEFLMPLPLNAPKNALIRRSKRKTFPKTAASPNSC